MPIGEFELIERYLSRLGARRDDVLLGVGDDAALLRPPPGVELASAADTIVEGVHFPPGMPAADIGHRVLAVNLSDMAAMGAEPAWALLTLTLPGAEEDWLRDFATGLHELARRHGTALVGGDTTAGPLTATVAITGFVPPGQALRLAVLQGRLAGPDAILEPLRQRFLRPEPRVGLGLCLRGLATACIDVSDGLVGDLGKLCESSGVGAELDTTRLPRSPAMRGAVDPEAARRFTLAGGDDYELLFTLPPGSDTASLERGGGVAVTRIGVIVAGSGVAVDGQPAGRELVHGFDHFR
jgi:thiamine-monophosphate kinase